jgi:hypothetical protein
MRNYDKALFRDKSKEQVKTANVQKTSKQTPPQTQTTTQKADMRRCLDGSFPLRNFRLSGKPFESFITFAHPIVPKVKK